MSLECSLTVGLLTGRRLGFLCLGGGGCAGSSGSVRVERPHCWKSHAIAHLIAHLVKLRFNKWRRYRGRQPTGPAGGGTTLVVFGEMLGELQWPTLEARRDQSSLLFFHKIHCGIMSIDKDKYLTPSQRTRSTRASHNSQQAPDL